MIPNRRAFLRSSSLAAVAAAFCPAWVIASPSQGAASTTGATLVVPGDEIVLKWVRSYSSRAVYVGGGVLGRLRQQSVRIHILAEVASLDALWTALTGPLPFSGIRTEGNTFSFVSGGTAYTVENLLPELFAKRLAALSAHKSGAFAYDSLSYDPNTRHLSDPFGATKGASLKVVGKVAGASAAFGLILRGWIESGKLGLTHGAGFGTLTQRVLGVPGGRGGLARPVVAAFVAQLPQLTQVLTTAQIAAVLRSRLVSGAIYKVLALSPDQVISQFLLLRSATTGEDADAVAWLAGLLGPTFQQGMTPDWFSSADASQAARTSLLLEKAASLVGAQTL